VPHPKAALLEDEWETPDPALTNRPDLGSEWIPRKHARSLYVESAAAYWRMRRRRPHGPRSSRDVGELFHSYASEWRADTMFESNLDKKILHSSYQKIIGLGPEALPFILRDLINNGGHWFWALAAIAGEDKAEGSATVDEAVELWKAWGIEMGLMYE
jgi:hypothetical protein